MVKQTELSKSCRCGFRAILLGLTLATTALLGFGAQTTAAQQSTDPVGNQGRQVTLKEQLLAGLKATTKSDKKFIDKVVILVHQGKLPRKMVDSTFLWARDRAARKSRTRVLRPMVYFRPALMLRAKRIGVKL